MKKRVFTKASLSSESKSEYQSQRHHILNPTLFFPSSDKFLNSYEHRRFDSDKYKQYIDHHRSINSCSLDMDHLTQFTQFNKTLTKQQIIHISKSPKIRFINMYKTKMCCNHNCTDSSRCFYAHEHHELRTPLCIFFKLTGTCAKGDSCRYLHDQSKGLPTINYGLFQSLYESCFDKDELYDDIQSICFNNN